MNEQVFPAVVLRRISGVQIDQIENRIFLLIPERDHELTVVVRIPYLKRHFHIIPVNIHRIRYSGPFLIDCKTMSKLFHARPRAHLDIGEIVQGYFIPFFQLTVKIFSSEIDKIPDRIIPPGDIHFDDGNDR